MNRPRWQIRFTVVTDRPPAPPAVATPPPGRGETILHPKLLWRLGFPLSFVWAVHFTVFQLGFHADALAFGAFMLSVLLLGSWAAWRCVIVIDGPLLYQHGLRRWKRPLDIRNVDWADLGWTCNRGDTYRWLRLESDGRSWVRSFTLRWWGRWRQIIRWMAKHRASFNPSGDPIWTIEMSDKARRRLNRYVRNSP